MLCVFDCDVTWLCVFDGLCVMVRERVLVCLFVRMCAVVCVLLFCVDCVRRCCCGFVTIVVVCV